MEYLAKEHQDLAKKGLDDIRGKLHAPKQTVLDAVKSKPEEFSYDRVFRMAQKFTNRSLPTASVIWEYLLGKVVNKQQKFAVMNKLFHVQIATGPWSVAFETATNLFNETTAEFAMEFSMDTGGAGPKTTSEGSLGMIKFCCQLSFSSLIFYSISFKVKLFTSGFLKKTEV